MAMAMATGAPWKPLQLLRTSRPQVNCSGCSYNVTEHSVRNYLFRIFNKLGTSNRLELALYVLEEKEKGMFQL